MCRIVKYDRLKMKRNDKIMKFSTRKRLNTENRLKHIANQLLKPKKVISAFVMSGCHHPPNTSNGNLTI